MKKEIQISNSEKKAVVNYFSNKLDENDLRIIRDWVRKDDSNKLFFDQISNIWQTGYFKIAEKNIDVNRVWNEIQNQLQHSEKSKRATIWNEIVKIAAVFVVALFLGGFGYHLLSKQKVSTQEPSFVEYFSPLGSRSFVQLIDGSKVWLNAGSTLKYSNSYGLSNREIDLAGEAFFEVEKNKSLPFVVKTSDIDIIALGTKFNVKAYSEEKTIETTLIEGSVKLESNTTKMNGEVVLKPNEKAVFTKKSNSLELITKKQTETQENTVVKPKLEIIESVETEPIVSWKDKRWVISNEKLGELAVKLERRYDVNFIFDNDLLKEYAFGGTLVDETLEQILEAISITAPIKYVIEGNTVYIMSDGYKIEKFKNLMTNLP